MNNGLLLWADDEMELLKAHLMFLEKKGYEVVTVTNGTDAIEECRHHTFDLVLLDEMMPGLSGLETLQRIKEQSPQTPVVMVTKSEEEDIMNQAIGQQIADYLIKPVNPNQILLTLKKNIHRREIVTETVQTSYQQQFQQLSMQIMDCSSWQDWTDIYRRLVRWELELSQTDSQMTEMLEMQKTLQEKYKSIWKPIGPDRGQDQLLWMIGEIGEVIDIVKKNGGEKACQDSALREHLIEEMADVLMYYNDILLCYGITEEELKAAYVTKYEKNMKRW